MRKIWRYVCYSLCCAVLFHHLRTIMTSNPTLSFTLAPHVMCRGLLLYFFPRSTFSSILLGPKHYQLGPKQLEMIAKYMKIFKVTKSQQWDKPGSRGVWCWCLSSESLKHLYNINPGNSPNVKVMKRRRAHVEKLVVSVFFAHAYFQTLTSSGKGPVPSIGSSEWRMRH